MNDNQILPVSDPAGASLPGQTNPPLRILVAEDGAVAWVALQTNRYDLLITDNSMPKVTGVELLEMLRSARMVLPVIMATGIMTEKRFTRYPRLEPAAVLLKPYTVETLLGIVSKILRVTDNIPEQIWQNEPLSANDARL